MITKEKPREKDDPDTEEARAASEEDVEYDEEQGDPEDPADRPERRKKKAIGASNALCCLLTMAVLWTTLGGFTPLFIVLVYCVCAGDNQRKKACGATERSRATAKDGRVVCCACRNLVPNDENPSDRPCSVCGGAVCALCRVSITARGETFDYCERCSPALL